MAKAAKTAKKASKVKKGKSLVIVESPSKAKTILKYLGKNFNVMASVGHVKDLPKSRFGIDIEHGFEPEYVVIDKKKKVLSELKKAAKEADKIYLAPDPDREGEAIAWHIAGELKSRNGDVYRVLFNEITQKAIQKAMESPGIIDQKKVDAQQARRVLDRIVGYKISPLLWEKVRRGLSAGRVQSVAVRIICEREREVLAFIPKEYWTIDANLLGAIPPPFVARLIQQKGETIELANEAEAQAIVKALRPLPFMVSKVEKKERKKNPTPPFTTSRLQQEAARKLRYTPKKTMMLAQQLYEGVETQTEGAVGLITYMRTDSVRVSPDFQGETREWIGGKYGREYLPDALPVYKSKKGAQEAHEAIRPTSLQRDPEQIKNDLTKDQYLLYKLIWNRFVASQMAPAILDVTRVDIAAGEFLLRATGSVVKFPGFTVVYMEGREEGIKRKDGEEEESAEQSPVDGEALLPELSAGQRLTLQALDPKQHFTQPPPRYNEALLIHDLEEKGIGRPSTYATIISTIQDREYVSKREARFYPTELGNVVNDLLVQHFPEVVNVEFTAKMENELDEIEEGEKEWVETIRGFYEPFSKNFDKAQVEMRDVKREETPTDLTCEKCAKPMVIKWGRFGRFLACSGYPECRNTKEFVETANGIEIVEKETATDEICEKCSKPMVIKNGRFGRFMACSGYPECENTKAISTGVTCPETGCGGSLVEKRTRRAKVFYACANYPKCKFALWDRPISRPCPECDAPFLVEKRDRSGGVKVLCRNESCGYEEEG
ncbi:MAG TPA: type I DNA topoisomerase [Candidatus Manganitrophaceae bacterium]|nr:type I DNA topoisomerase [Candidatus Manganitrophaceae bacterium]